MKPALHVEVSEAVEDLLEDHARFDFGDAASIEDEIFEGSETAVLHDDKFEPVLLIDEAVQALHDVGVITGPHGLVLLLEAAGEFLADIGVGDAIDDAHVDDLDGEGLGVGVGGKEDHSVAAAGDAGAHSVLVVDDFALY